MKSRLLIFSVAVLLAACVTETTRTITTDKNGTVHDTTVTRKGTDPAALKLAEVAVAVYVPRRPMLVREEKSGPITAAEIENRWKPTP